MVFGKLLFLLTRANTLYNPKYIMSNKCKLLPVFRKISGAGLPYFEKAKDLRKN